MPRKRLTQVFPFLLPLRKKQKVACFYLAMRFDGRTYAQKKVDYTLPYQIVATSSLMVNENSGQDIQFQYNKVHNLKLAAKTLDRILIKPGEVFSFWLLVKEADRFQEYQEALVLQDDKLTTVKGGGLCQISTVLYWLFLQSPLTVIERHGHKAESFPIPPSEIPDGVEATIHEGWQDLKVKNETDTTYQIQIWFDDSYLYGSLLANHESPYRYEIYEQDRSFFRENGILYRKNKIYRKTVQKKTGTVVDTILLLEPVCALKYQPQGITIQEGEHCFG